MAVELLKATTQVIHHSIQFEVRPWKKIKQELADNQLDVLPLVGRTPEREKLFDFTVPYLSLYGAIVVHQDNKTINNLSDLKDRKIGVMASDNAEEYMRRKGYSDFLITTETYAEALNLLNQKQLDAVVMQQIVAQKMITKLKLTDIKIRHRLIDFRQDFCFAVTKGDNELLAQLNEGLSKVIINNTYHQLKQKWLGNIDSDVFESSPQWNHLSETEKQWIKDNPEVLFTGDPNWLPYEAFEKNGNYIGIVADHLKLIEKQSGIKFKKIPSSSWTESLKLATKGQVSVISGDAADDILNQKFLPIDSYSQNPIVIIMNIQQNYVEDLKIIKDKKIAIIKDYGYTADIFKTYPDIEFIEVENIQQGLEGVSQGSFDAMLATMALASYSMADLGIHNLKIVGKTPIIMNLTLFVSKQQPVLHSIINKTLKSIPISESQKIKLNWVPTKYVERTDYKMLAQVSFIFLLILIFILFWNKKLKKEINKRREIEQKLIEKEELIITQSRHAAMGEMIGMIAHQWRQPISVIAMDANNVLADIDLEIVSETSLKTYAHSTLKQTEHLSQTIDDFRNFFRPNKAMDEVRIEEVVGEAEKIISKMLEHNNISFSIKTGNSLTVNTYSRELLQVYINLLNNAKEALLECRTESRRINIVICDDKENVTTTICDNGGGIDNAIIQKIFDPYFSTKQISSGTGLGLYMSKTIVEKHLQGTLNVENTENGVCFKVAIPLLRNAVNPSK